MTVRLQLHTPATLESREDGDCIFTMDFSTMDVSNPFTLSLLVHIFYLCTYTAWDKENKQLQTSNVADVVLLRRGLSHTLNELNKILSLTGLTILPLAYFLHNPYDHLYLSLWSQVVHAIYSSWKYYGTKVAYVTEMPNILVELNTKRPKVFIEGVKKVSILCGALSLALLASHIYVPEWDAAAVGILVLFTALVHFYTMEIDYKFVLHVRTTGNLTIVYCLAAMVGLAVVGTKIQ